jgi:hypothetical protein
MGHYTTPTSRPEGGEPACLLPYALHDLGTVLFPYSGSRHQFETVASQGSLTPCGHSYNGARSRYLVLARNLFQSIPGFNPFQDAHIDARKCRSIDAPSEILGTWGITPPQPPGPKAVNPPACCLMRSMTWGRSSSPARSRITVQIPSLGSRGFSATVPAEGSIWLCGTRRCAGLRLLALTYNLSRSCSLVLLTSFG